MLMLKKWIILIRISICKMEIQIIIWIWLVKIGNKCNFFHYTKNYRKSESKYKN
jgi:hypothetical protein